MNICNYSEMHEEFRWRESHLIQQVEENRSENIEAEGMWNFTIKLL